MTWRDLAACRGMDTNLFYPRRGDSVGVARARAVCASCPVRQECLDDALATESPSDGGSATRATVGVRGGLSARERIRLPRPVAVAAPISHGTTGGYRTHLRRREEPCQACADAQARYRNPQGDSRHDGWRTGELGAG